MTWQHGGFFTREGTTGMHPVLEYTRAFGDQPHRDPPCLPPPHAARLSRCPTSRLRLELMVASGCVGVRVTVPPGHFFIR